jgi:hypothetical protein
MKHFSSDVKAAVPHAVGPIVDYDVRSVINCYTAYTVTQHTLLHTLTHCVSDNTILHAHLKRQVCMCIIPVRNHVSL